MKKLFSRSLLMTFVIALISTIAQGQVTYTASPSGWTSVPGKNITATPINQTVTLHGNLLVARAVISGKNVTFQAKKSDGTIFQNATILYLHENDANGTRKKISRNSAGSSVLNLDFEFDFTSGSKKYCLTLCSNTSSGDQIWYYTSPITITAKSTEVAKPDYTTFTGTNITSNSFEASWSHVNGATSYEINVATDKNYNPIVFNKTTSNNYITVTGLQANTSYYFQVRAKVNGVWSDWSKSISSPVTTKSAETPKPDYTTFTGTNITSNSFEASWSHVNGATSYEINVATDKNYNPIVFNKTTSNNYITVTGLQANTSYYFQVRAKVNGVWSDWSKSISSPVTTKSAETPKPDYTTFTGTNVTSNSFEASWSHVTGATSYEINVATDKNYNPIVFNKTTSNNYITVTGLQANTSYYFQVRAKVNGVWGDWSKSISSPVTTKSAEAPKPDYTTFTGTNITSNSFEASWSHVTGATSYEINVATDKNYNPIVFNKTTSNNYITVTGLQANTSYYFQVRAKVNGVWGDWSKSISTPVTTTAATPSEVKLTIVGGTYFGSSTLTKGKSASFNIKIKNEGNTDWSGAFYLKGNGTNWIPWGGKSIPAGVTLSLNSSYTPTATGNYTVTLYYQTGGEGDGLPVDKGYFKNPFTVTVTDGQSTKVLDHPDNASLKAVEVGSTSIKVTWGTVKEATDYDVLMKESSSTSYTNGKVGYGTQDYPYYTFTGLIPNTSYTFQVRARNDNAKSDYSKGCVVLTSAAKEENPSLGIFSKHGLAVEAGDPIYKDQSYKYTVGVQNISGKSWSGKLILRNGNEKIKEWKGVNLSSTGGNHFTCNYTPTVTGQQTLCLYYQTGSEGQEMMVKGDDDYENPLYLIVGDKKATTCLLSMRTSIIASSEHHYIDEPVTLQARVYNDDTKDWKGSLYFTINGEIAITTNVPKIPAGGYYDLSRKWQPMEAGKYSIGVSYRKSGDASTEPQPVLLNGQPVSLVVEIKDPDNIPAPEKLKVAFASENLYPQEVREGAAVNYFFRITDENDKPVRNVKLCFACENGYSSFPMETSLSGADGIAVLHVETPVRVKSGETAKFVYDVLKYKDNTKIAFINKADLDPIALKVHKSSIFENVEKVDFTLDLGLGLNAEAGIAQGNINASIPLRFSMKYGDNGDVSKYILGIGLKAGIGASVGTDLLGFPIKGTAGFTLEGGVDYSLSTENLYAAALEGILKLCESWGSSTNSDYDFAVKVLLSWFEHKSKLTWSNSAFISTGIMGDFSFEMPSTFKRGNLLTGKTKVLYDPSAITGMSASYNGKLTYKPKMEETDENNVTTYGEAVSLSNKGSLSAGFSSFAPDILFGSKKTWWRDAGMGSFFENHLKEMLHYSSVKAGFNVEMSFEQEEKFEDESRTKLKELSHGMAIKTGLGITVNDLINPWGKKGDKFSLDASTSSKIKVTSKNNFAGYLQRLANESNTKRETIGNVFPIFADQSCLASPFRMFTVWNSDGIENSLSQLVENVYDPAYHFPLNEALTVTQSNASSLSARLKVPIVDWGWLSLTFDVGLGIATNYRPTYSYYSVADKRFFPVVLQPVSTIQSIVNSALQRLADGISGAFDDEDQEEIKKEADEMQHYMTSEVYAGTMVDMNFDNYQRPFVANSPALAARAMRRHPALLSKPQTDICTLGFNINNGEQNFDEGTTLSFSHYYPDGDLFAVTDQGDTLFVVSEVTTLGAMRDGSNLQTSHRGSFRLDTYVGNDDLSPFGLSEDTQLDIYHAVKGTDVWHYVGKAGTPVMVDSLGQYILATSIHNDHTAPEVTMDFNPQSRILNIALSDNIGVRVGTLQVMINNELRKAEAQNEYNYSVELTDDDMKYLIEVYATVNDLAGNKGELYQMFNLDMPQRPSETQQPGDDFEVTDISILDNVVYLTPVEVHAGEEATLSVKMKNNVNAEGFGFDLYLPYGMNFKLDADGFPEAYLSTERTSARKTNTFESVIRPDGALRVMAASTNGSVISGSDGEVALVTILVDKDVQPGIYPLLLREIAISDSDARSYDTDAVRTTITVLDGASNIHEVMSPRHFDNHIYNLQGQRVTTLTKGIYIKNGRKFVVR